MRKLMIFGFALSLFAFTACQKDEVKIADEAGEIAGMGNADGELQASDFSLPEGISLVGDIDGTIVEEETPSASLKSANSLFCYGSGGRYVKVRMTLKNNSNYRRTAWLPAGLLFQVQNSGYQNAILLCWTWVCFKANEIKEVEVWLYCLNRGLPGSLVNTKYKMLGVTSSKRMERIIWICRLKKINVEHLIALNEAGLKSAVNYDDMVNQIQDIIWAETNDDGITPEQEAFLNSLPDLEEGAVPPTILNDDFLDNAPYWEEYRDQ